MKKIFQTKSNFHKYARLAIIILVILAAIFAIIQKQQSDEQSAENKTIKDNIEESQPTEHNSINCSSNEVVEKFNTGAKEGTCPSLRVSANDILVGAQKDSIPAIDEPRFVSAQDTRFSDNELIIGLKINSDIRAYPYSILNWHEIVNDTVGGVPVTITYCPLCETNSVFIREIGENKKETTFGVSGGLYHSCLVMYDRSAESLWTQPWGVAVSGPNINEQLERIPAARTTLGEWKEKYPETLVLSDDTGHSRDYNHYPYGDFYTNSEILFPARNQDKRNGHPKDITFILFEKETKNPFDLYGGSAAQVKLNDLREEEKIQIKINDKDIEVVYDKELNSAQAFSEGREVPLMAAFNFVFHAFFEK